MYNRYPISDSYIVKFDRSLDLLYRVMGCCSWRTTWLKQWLTRLVGSSHFMSLAQTSMSQWISALIS